MEKKIISTSMSPELFIDEIMGDLQIKGWDRSEIEYLADIDDMTVEEKDDVIHLSCQGDLSVRVPNGTSIKVGQVHGDARFKLLEEPLSIDQVNGTITLRSVGDVKAGQVNGDLIARQINGDLRVDQINGNAHGRDLQGICSLNRVNGNLDLQAAGSPVQAEVDGNARLRLAVLSEAGVSIQADGNIQVEIPAEANASLKLSSEGSLIRLRLPGNTQTYHQENLELKLGTGVSQIELSASGNVSVSNLEINSESSKGSDEEFDPFTHLPPDFGERIAQQVESQIESQMEFMTRQMNEQLERMTAAFGKSGMSQKEADRIMEETRKKSEEAAAQAQEKMRRSQEKMERKMDAHRRRAEAQTQAAERRAQSSSRAGWTFKWPPSTPPPAPGSASRPQASEEERLLILKMLEQKKISLEEAANLLEALEGNGG